MKSCIYWHCTEWYSGYGGWEYCAKFWWVTKSFDEMIKSTKSMKCIDRLRNFSRYGEGWRSRFIFMNFFHGECRTDNRKLTFRYVKYMIFIYYSKIWLILRYDHIWCDIWVQIISIIKWINFNSWFWLIEKIYIIHSG